jgi:hypothetical protein
MSTVKTKIQKEKVDAFLQNHFQKNILKLASVEGGEMSQAFSFHKEGEDLIIRRQIISFEKLKVI